MQAETLKSKMEHLIHKLPDNAGIEDAMERLYLLAKIEKGIKQADEGDVYTQDEAREKLAKWLK